MVLDYLYNEFKIVAELYYNFRRAGVRVSIDGKLYDVDIENYFCFTSTAKLANLRLLDDMYLPKIELKYVEGYLVSLQDKKKIPELNYNELCFLTGTLVNNSSVHLKNLYDLLNRTYFENKLPYRVCINWSGDMTNHEYEVRSGVVNFRFVKGEPDSILYITLSYPLISSHPNVAEFGLDSVLKRRLLRIMYKIFKNDTLTKLTPQYKHDVKEYLSNDNYFVNSMKEGTLRLSGRTFLESMDVPEIEKASFRPKWNKITQERTFYSPESRSVKEPVR